MPWDEIVEWGREAIDSNFQAGGRPSPWPPLKKTGEPSFLQDTGELRDSIDSIKTGHGVEVGYDMDYGIYHRTGTSKMPQRDFGVVLDTDYNELHIIMHHWVEDKLGPTK